mmetsp:Transcript_5066/g.5684  ORF Transcript_5066/g.5684 Transcript_5066/m.5684 type:complete len:129 (+) Transcript_5066:1035-1421(+)
MEQQKRQLDQLMKKSSSLLPLAVLQKDILVHAKETSIVNCTNDKKDKSQKRSFDYSNYIRNKRQQGEIGKAEQLKVQRNEEALEFQAKKDRKERELNAKTAKKRAARQKKLNKLKESRLNKIQANNEK